MKKTIFKRSLATTGIILFLITGLTNSIVAQTLLDSTKNENPVEFKYLGKIKENPLFQLNMHNSETGDFLIKVKNANGTLLYSEKLKGEKITRKYQLDITSAEILEPLDISFEIFNIKTRLATIYNLTLNSYLTDVFHVAKL